MRNIIALSLLFSVGFCGIASPEPIGKTTKVVPAAQGSVGGTLAIGNDVHSQETVSTDTGGKAGLEFKDQSKLDIGPNSAVKMDKFIYNPNRSAGDVTLSASRGTFRFVTGTQGKGVYKVKTPYGSLGIRG